MEGSGGQEAALGLWDLEGRWGRPEQTLVSKLQAQHQVLPSHAAWRAMALWGHLDPLQMGGVDLASAQGKEDARGPAPRPHDPEAGMGMAGWEVNLTCYLLGWKDLPAPLPYPWPESKLSLALPPASPSWDRLTCGDRLT